MILLPGIAWGGGGGYDITRWGKLTVSPQGDGSVYIKGDDGKYTKTEHTKSEDDSGDGSAPSSLNISFDCRATPGKGYKFDGWKETISASNFISTASDYTYTFAAESDNENNPTSKTLYGYFSAKEYTIKYSSDGGVTVPKDQTYYITTTSIEISQNTPSRTGYTFDGWTASYTDTAGGGGWDTSKSYQPGAPIPNDGSMYGNVTLTAKWTKIPYTITYSSVETCIRLPENQTYYIETNPISLSKAIPERAGYNFTGWTASGGNGWNTSAAYYQPGASIDNTNKSVYGDVTLTAGWAKEADPSFIRVNVSGMLKDDHAIFNISYEKQGQTVNQQIAIHEYAIVKIPGGVTSVTVEPSKWTEKTYTITPGETTKDVTAGNTTSFIFSAEKSGQNIFETSREF